MHMQMSNIFYLIKMRYYTNNRMPKSATLAVSHVIKDIVKDVKQKLSFTTGRNAKWYSYFGVI